MMVWFSSLCLLLFIITPSHSSTSPPYSPSNPLCHPYESSALLAFKNSFPVINETDSYYNNTMYWDMGKDCCSWSGVTCDELTGHVIGLNLSCGGLRGVIDSNNSLFSLTHLQTLDLSFNDFDGSEISPNFGRFVGMIHLHLTYSGFTGQVPLELAYLSKLQTLYLTSYPDSLRLKTSSFKQIVSNLTNLQELSLGGVNMSSVLPSSFMNLSTSLTSLHLSDCELKGEFPENIFRLPNLHELDLTYNRNLTGLLPKYNWTSPLRYLSLSYCGFTIDFPHLIRNLNFLNELHVSNCNLIGKCPALLDNITQITSLDMSLSYFGGQIPWHCVNLENVTDLDLSYNNFVGTLPEICRNSTRKNYLCDPSNNQLLGPLPLKLQSLWLSGNFLNGTIPSWLYSLPSLQDLSLSNNHLTGQINEFQFNSLRNLRLDSNQLQGPFPRSIFQQVNLSWLDLSSNNLSGVLKMEQFSKLINLNYITLSFNSLSLVFKSGTDCTLPNSLVYLYLSSCNISEFPYHLRSLENLSYLDLSHNRIEGSVPQWMSNVGKDSLYFLNISHNFLTHMSHIPWKRLNIIDLRSNQLQGHLPIPPLSTWFFFASNNHFTGKMSSLFCNLSSILVLDLSNNTLSGNIPPCIGNFINSLSILDLRMNKFDGLIPSSFVKGNSLTSLNLNGNQLEGPLPQSLVNCESLKVLDVANNSLNGSFPWWLESLPELQVLILRSNRFHGAINNPKVRSPFQRLRVMDISDNRFTGVLPEKYLGSFVAMMDAHWDNWSGIQIMLITIDFSKNNFTGEIPELIGKLNSLTGLSLSHNKLTGPIPTSFGNLSNLEWLDLSSNELVGNIPLCIGNFSNSLSILDLRMNKFDGVIPSSFGKGNPLAILHLSGNQLEGPLPQSILNCEGLEVLDVGNNRLNGSFPWWLESLPELQVLILRSNRFHGAINNPKVRFPFQKLRIIDVSDNTFIGVLPEKYLGSFVAMRDAHSDALFYMMDTPYCQDSVVVAIKGSYVELEKIQIMFITIDFSRNNFTGEIPELIGNLNSLKGLNLSHNKLSGPIPTSFGNLSNLEWLDLSSNELVGNIPWQLAANLYQLAFINVSNNQLEGRIPQGKQFDTFDNDSYSGNPGLCGFPLSKSCGELTPDEEDEGDDHNEGLIDWKIVMMGYAGGVVIGLSIGYIVFFSRRFDYWLAKRIGREPQRRCKTNGRFRGRGRN